MTPSIREVYGQTLAEIGAENDRIVVLDADVSASTRSIVFAEKFPHRFFNCGIAEANMAAMAAGLAHGGMTVFANTFAAFITTNSLLSVRSLIAYSHANVKLMGAYAGLSDAYDGYTHHSIDDLAIMRAIPDMRVMVASDAEQTRFLLRYAAETDGPMYIRLSRDAMNDLNRYGRLTFGKGSVLREGTDATILACGALCGTACQAAAELAKQNIHVRVADMFTIKPLDRELVIRSARETGALVTAEEHSVIGGLGGAVAETLTEAGACVPVIRVGVSDTVTESGPYGQLLAHYGLDVTAVANAVERALSLKRAH